jgi:CDP-diacylglycerol---glycerol-3-phosphate 3-phosphatidyltransferase
VNLPNMLSLLRAALVVPLALALRDGASAPVAGVLLGMALATDLLDGAIARRLDQTTDLGRILDPLADKLLVGGGLLALAMTRRVPMELAVVVILRDAALLGTAWVRMRGGAPVPSATPAGKVAFALLGLYLGGVVLGVTWAPWVAPLAGGVYVLAGVGYAMRLPGAFPGRVLKEER